MPEEEGWPLGCVRVSLPLGRLRGPWPGGLFLCRVGMETLNRHRDRRCGCSPCLCGGLSVKQRPLSVCAGHVCVCDFRGNLNIVVTNNARCCLLGWRLPELPAPNSWYSKRVLSVPFSWQVCELPRERSP